MLEMEHFLSVKKSEGGFIDAQQSLNFDSGLDEVRVKYYHSEKYLMWTNVQVDFIKL